MLGLRGNRLRRLPASMARLSRLLSLDLRGNPLEAWPAAIADLPVLEKLDLRWVALPQAPPWVDALRARGCVVYV